MEAREPHDWNETAIADRVSQARPEGLCARASSAAGEDLRGEHERIFRPGIARGTKQAHFAETCSAELVEEGTTLLGARDSGEPVGRTLPLWRKRPRKDQLGRVHGAARTNHPGQFFQDFAPRRIEVEQAVDQGQVHAGVGQR